MTAAQKSRYHMLTEQATERTLVKAQERQKLERCPHLISFACWQIELMSRLQAVDKVNLETLRTQISDLSNSLSGLAEEGLTLVCSWIIFRVLSLGEPPLICWIGSWGLDARKNCCSEGWHFLSLILFLLQERDSLSRANDEAKRQQSALAESLKVLHKNLNDAKAHEEVPILTHALLDCVDGAA